LRLAGRLRYGMDRVGRETVGLVEDNRRDS
jgi:hypothetical protein